MSGHSLRDRRWRAVRLVVLERDGHQCLACGATQDLTVDHVDPVSTLTDDQLDAGQQYSPDYLATLCRPCNSSKGNRKPNSIRPTWIAPAWADALAPVFPHP